MTNQGMLVCSFSMKKRFTQGEENIYSLNHQYQLDNEDNTVTFENANEMFQLFCQANASFSDNQKKKKSRTPSRRPCLIVAIPIPQCRLLSNQAVTE